MRLTMLSLLAMLVAGTVLAQPTLTQATNSFSIGQSHTLNYSPYAVPGAGGGGQTWDLSGLQVDSTTFIQWVDPATTASGALFPQATIAEVWEVVSFSQQDATGLYVLGTDEQGTVVALTDTRRALKWPLTYQDSWSDTYAGTYTVQGFDIMRTGTYAGEADAYGTLQLPWGTVENALRVHVTAEQSDVSLFGTIAQDIDSYQWFVPGEPWPVVEVVNNTVTSPVGTITVSYTLWMSDPVTAVRGRSILPGLRGWMLPGGAAYQLDRPVHGVVFDAAGQRVATLDRHTVIDLQGLTPGLYIVRSDDGALLRFIRE
jgi:hypothetical protein